ncbi:zinc metalloprotease HtpX [Methermicoccus shengliensis]|uniref:Protease HtpX homolog n=1 Tax=Methermicoccus shengliensis TaxID=660064 RepID=A0A832VNH5_9EURY|nr:zinc metalloprotease HtpX [Methermicoccus shengliensis]KUK04757.1 MAG: Protease HtpX-like protein [Euryarchaeota archaeon 55_53]KUK29917.1 MAG: Protease HtpX-like protein [Methanosarcinales archeaon 56_1174]MDI3487674.1 heat shock protein HtpX [Methanosarcinales archaeon]MDN5295562.1 heat shock protein HtpX [Methanosarcinales archaeon]HIH70321.1 zinc metalloprotease HtpX [Methermicoccus shengliensis]
MRASRRYGRDMGLAVRMFLTMLLLAAVYLAFLVVLSRMFALPFVLLFVGAFMFAQFYYSDRLVLWSLGAKEVSPSEAPKLHSIVERLCSIADLPKPRIAIVPSQVPNALATGRSKSNAVVAVTEGLLNTLDTDELEAVLAHELSHIKHRDMLVLTIASFISTIAYFIMHNFYFLALGGDRREGNAPLLLIFVASLLTWIISYLLIRALSRYREFAADRGSAIITGRPRSLISALYKISGRMQRIPTRDIREVEGMNAFFIIPAISGESLLRLFSTHPPLEKRVEALERIERAMESV